MRKPIIVPVLLGLGMTVAIVGMTTQVAFAGENHYGQTQTQQSAGRRGDHQDKGKTSNHGQRSGQGNNHAEYNGISPTMQQPKQDEHGHDNHGTSPATPKVQPVNDHKGQNDHGGQPKPSTPTSCKSVPRHPTKPSGAQTPPAQQTPPSTMATPSIPVLVGIGPAFTEVAAKPASAEAPIQTVHATPISTTTGSLAFTGANTWLTVGGAMALLIVGGIFVFGSRRRRSAI